MKTSFLSLLIVCTFIGCNSHNSIPEKGIARDTIPLPDLNIEQEQVRLSDITDSINYYPIPTDDDYLIGRVSKILVTDSLYIIADNKITHSVFIFSRNQTFKSLIHQHGDGPTEYLRLSDAFYNNTLKKIGIYCNLKKEILYYHLNGEYSHRYEIPYRGESIYPMGTGFILHTEYQENVSLKKGNKYPDLIFVKKENDTASPVCGNYFEGPVNHSIVWSSDSNMSTWKDTVAIKPDHSNIVYHCTSEGLYPAYFLDCGNNNIDERFWNKVSETNMDINKLEEYCRSKNLCEIIWYLESERFISFTCKQKGILTQVLYSKRSKNIRTFRTIENDMESYASFIPKAIKGNKVYRIIPAYSIVQQGKLNNRQKLPLSLQHVKESDNPIIVEFVLKDF